ncbi:MAG TPA: hypothetical protein VJB16_01910, partial [archaeon]|nr:hypothetical protein [archaeon]
PFVYKERNVQYRYIAEESFSPLPTAVFGDNVVLMVWEPLTIIIVRNKEQADAYRKHFELLWKVAV